MDEPPGAGSRGRGHFCAGGHVALVLEFMIMPARSWGCSALRSVVVFTACVLLVTGGDGASAEAAAPDSRILLTQGTTYRARLRLSFFQCLASRDRVRRKLQGSGFSDVQVFTSTRELPPDWPPQFRGRAGSCERYAEGIWSRPTMPRARPSSIEAWWVARSPAPP